jgi:phosphoserine phosphatase
MAGDRDTTIVLVRHGEVPGVVPPSFRGRADLLLTDRGLSQAALARDFLASHVRFSAAYASPLSRAMRTGEIIAKPHAIAVSPLPDFVDIDYGDWQGRTFDEVRSAAPEAFNDWRRRPHLAAIPNGETLADVGARVTRVMQEVIPRHPGETVLVVGHDSVNRVFLLIALELSLSQYWRIHQDTCGVNILTYDDDGWTAKSINETAHLPPQR